MVGDNDAVVDSVEGEAAAPPMPTAVQRVASGPVYTVQANDIEDAKKASESRFRRFFASMLEAGVYLAPSPFEAGFVSLAHRRKEIRETLATTPLAEAGISLFAVSTYDTDYLLVRADDLERAIDALARHGHRCRR